MHFEQLDVEFNLSTIYFLWYHVSKCGWITFFYYGRCISTTTRSWMSTSGNLVKLLHRWSSWDLRYGIRALLGVGKSTSKLFFTSFPRTNSSLLSAESKIASRRLLRRSDSLWSEFQQMSHIPVTQPHLWVWEEFQPIWGRYCNKKFHQHVSMRIKSIKRKVPN